MRSIIKANDDNIHIVIKKELLKLGFDSDLNHIDVSQVTKMNSLFSSVVQKDEDPSYGGVYILGSGINYTLSDNYKFNGNISNWDVSNVINMEEMFCDFFVKTNFSGDLSNWNVSNVTNMRNMFHNSPLKGREPWWYILFPLFGSTKLMWDSLDFEWIDLEEKIIYRDKLIKTLRRGYNTKWNGEFPKIRGFEWK